MTPKERVLAAANHQVTDRVAITFEAEKEVYAALYEHLGVDTKEAVFDRLNVDTWYLIPGNFVYTPEEEGKSVKTTIWGYNTRVAEYSGGSYEELCFSPLAGKHDIEDMKRHQWPCMDILDFSHFQEEAQAHPDLAMIGVFTWGAWFIASFLRGMEDLLIDFAVRKHLAHYLIDAATERILAGLNAMLDTAADSIDTVYMADDYCSQRGPLFSPSTFEEFMLPYVRQVAETTHKHGKKFLLHVCGAVRPLLPALIDAGVDLLEPIQVRAAGMDPEGLKRDFGKDLCFWGGLDLQQVLCRGTAEQVSDEVKRLVRTLGEGGGYVFGPGHTYIQIDAPIENILAMYDTASACKG